MKKLAAFLSLCPFLFGTCSEEPQRGVIDLLVENARVIIGDGRVISEADVLVDRGRILEVRTKGETAASRRTIDGRGLTLLPGLIDCHVHLLGGSITGKAQYENFLKTKIPVRLTGFLKHGFTTIKSFGDPADLILGLRRDVAAGKIPGPRLVVVGPNFTAPGGHPTVTMAADDPWLRSVLAFETDDPSMAREEVRRLAGLGVDAIKVVYQGGSYQTLTSRPVTLKKLRKDVLRAIIEEAATRGLPVTAHTHYYDDALEFIEMGGAGLEHGVFGETLKDDRLSTAMKKTSAYYVPTLQFLSLDQSRRTLASGSENLSSLAKAGVQIDLGTDMHCGFQIPGETNLKELELMVKAGLTPARAIEAATLAAARHLELERDIGSVEPGKIADLILVKGNPLDDIARLKNLEAVIQNGCVVEQSAETSSGKNTPAAAESGRRHSPQGHVFRPAAHEHRSIQGQRGEYHRIEKIISITESGIGEPIISASLLFLYHNFIYPTPTQSSPAAYWKCHTPPGRSPSLNS